MICLSSSVSARALATYSRARAVSSSTRRLALSRPQPRGVRASRRVTRATPASVRADGLRDLAPGDVPVDRVVSTASLDALVQRAKVETPLPASVQSPRRASRRLYARISRTKSFERVSKRHREFPTRVSRARSQRSHRLRRRLEGPRAQIQRKGVAPPRLRLGFTLASRRREFPRARVASTDGRERIDGLPHVVVDAHGRRRTRPGRAHRDDASQWRARAVGRSRGRGVVGFLPRASSESYTGGTRRGIRIIGGVRDTWMYVSGARYVYK